jgi:hypothetical protein
MKKIALLSFFVLLNFAAFPQQSFIKQSLVVNVEVPVRVFHNGAFVENLSIDDFEVLEDGVSQKVEAVYLVKKRAIEKSEEKRRFAPETSRNFFLNFEISEYTAQIGEAVDYFIQNVILPGDTLYIIAPMKTYRLKEKALEGKSKPEIAKELKGLLRRDSLAGTSEYNATIQELSVLTRSLSAAVASGKLDGLTDRGAGDPKEADAFSTGIYSGLELDEQLVHYEGLLHKLELLRKIDEMKLEEFAKFLKNKEGQKCVFLFYQREFIPRIDPKILNQYINLYQERQDVVSTLTGISNLQRREISFDVNRIKQAYADSSISVHFLFITKPAELIPGIVMEEHSEDIYASFKEMASASGGFAESSSNPMYLFQKALNAAENYYLLYYSPKDYDANGKFREIKVRVKNEDYQVTHRAGYFAN